MHGVLAVPDALQDQTDPPMITGSHPHPLPPPTKHPPQTSTHHANDTLHRQPCDHTFVSGAPPLRKGYTVRNGLGWYRASLRAPRMSLDKRRRAATGDKGLGVSSLPMPGDLRESGLSPDSHLHLLSSEFDGSAADAHMS